MFTLKVEGMSCDGCAASVRRAVGRVAPAASVTVDLGSGLVSVAGAERREAIAAAIAAAGYAVKDGDRPDAA